MKFIRILWEDISPETRIMLTRKYTSYLGVNNAEVESFLDWLVGESIISKYELDHKNLPMSYGPRTFLHMTEEQAVMFRLKFL